MMQSGELISSRRDDLDVDAIVEEVADSVLNVSAKAQSAEVGAHLQGRSSETSSATPIQMLAQSPATLQAKELRSVRDSYEEEADAVSRNVLDDIGGASESRSEASRETTRPRLKVTGASVQRLSADARTHKGDSASAEIQRARSGGEGIPEVDRKPMEQSFGTDFGDVRVHTDTRADTLNKSLGARAFTSGKDVFFKSGQYAPGGSSGRSLLAHELTHVVQQSRDTGALQANGGPAIQRAIDPGADMSLRRAIMFGAGAGCTKARDLFTNQDTITQAEQRKAIAFRGVKSRAENRVHMIKAMLLSTLASKISFWSGLNQPERGLRDGRAKVKEYKAKIKKLKVFKSSAITPETRSRLNDLGVHTDGMAITDFPKVEFAATKLPGKTGGISAHSYIRYTDDEGEMFYVRAHDTRGQLKADYGKYQHGIHEYDVRGGNGRLIAKGPAASNKWDALKAGADQLNDKDIKYNVSVRNCNTAARYILKKAGYGFVWPKNLWTFFGGGMSYLGTKLAKRAAPARVG